VSTEENKALVRRFFEAHSNGDFAAMEQQMAPDFVDHSPRPGQAPDRKGYLHAVAEDHAAFSDNYLTVEDQAAEEDKVISRLTINRIHDREEFMGLVPTGMELKTSAIVIHRIAGGKIAEEWSESRRVLEATQQRLDREKREFLERELRLAQRIQKASLPKAVPTLEGWEISTYYQPAREVGGDFYDFFELPNGHLGLIVGDATGKGIPAALVMATTCGMLRAVALSLDLPGEVLQRVNEALSARIPANMFVTCFYAILDPRSGRLSYANAGHDLPYLHRNGDAEELRARGMPLGLMPGMSYEQKEIALDAGDSTLFYSDGLVEAHDPRGEMFGFPRLRELVAGHGEQRSLGDFLMKELYSFVGEGWEQEDDITLLTLRRSTASR
jgi:serine phosphatase RsbU (regulator of sigma subunit)